MVCVNSGVLFSYKEGWYYVIYCKIDVVGGNYMSKICESFKCKYYMFFFNCVL